MDHITIRYDFIEQDNIFNHNPKNENNLGDKTTQINQINMDSHMDIHSDVMETVIINVGGLKHEVLLTTLHRLPNSKLADLQKLAHYFRREKNEYYFDRNPVIFADILNVYRTGELHVPHGMCGISFKKELDFWGLDETMIEECCWIKYCTDMKTKKIARLFSELFSFPKNNVPNTGKRLGFRARIRSRVWHFMEYPSSSVKAQVRTP